MANKPTYFDIQDYDSGKTYRVEAYEDDVTYDEALNLLSTLPEEELAQYEYNPQVQQASPVPTPAEPVAVSTPEAATPVSTTNTLPKMKADDYEFGMDKFLDFSPEKQGLNTEEQQVVAGMVNDPNVPVENIGTYLEERGLTFGGDFTPEKIAENRAKGVGYAGYAHISPFEGMVDEQALAEEYAPESDSFFAQVGRSAVSGWADVASLMNALDRGKLDFFDVYADKVREQFPNATPEQLAELEDQFIGYMARKRSEAAEQAVANDDFIPWLAGQFLAVEPYDVVPIGRAAKAATKAGRVAEKAVEGAAVATVGDVVGQGMAMAGYAQDEFDPLRTLASAGLSGVMAGVGQGFAEFAPGGNKQDPTTSTTRIAVPTGDRRSKAYKAEMVDAVNQANSHVAKTTEGWTNKPAITVHNNFAKLQGVERKALGVYMGDGTIALNLERIAQKAARDGVEVEDVINATVFHESLGHFALNQEYGATLDSVLTRFYDNGNTKFKNLVDEWLAEPKYKKLYASGDPRGLITDPELYRRVRATEEVMAKWAEDRGVIPQTFMDTLSNMIKNFLRKMGRDISYSPREIKSILGVAQRQVTSKTGTDAAAPGSPRYMYIGNDQLVSNVVMRNGDEQRSQSLLDDLEVTRDLYIDEVLGANGSEELQAIQRRYGFDGKSREVTGWFLGPDGKWRLEISDDKAALVDMPEPGQSAKLEDILVHDELFDLYPELGEIVVEIGDESFSSLGEFYKNKIKLNKRYYLDWESGDPQKERELLSTLIHEVQHGVQDREYFGYGGSPEHAYKYLPNKVFYTGIRNLADNIRKYELKKLTVVRDAAEVVRNSKEYREYIEANDYAKEAWAILQRSKEILGDDAASTRHARDIWLQRDKLAGDAKERFNATLGLPKWVTEAEVSKQDIKDYFDLMKAVENPEDANNKINDLSEDITVLELALKNRNRDTRREAEKIVRRDPLASFEAYQALFGEVEARDTELRLNLTEKERRATKPYSLEGKYDPEDFAVTRYEGLPSKEPTQSQRLPTEEETTSSGGFRIPKPDSRMIAEDRKLRLENARRNEEELYGDNRYMMDDEEDGLPLSEDDIFELMNAKDIIDELRSGYVNEPRSWGEVKREAALRGIKASDIRKLKGVGDVSARLYQYDKLQEKLNERVTMLYNKMQNGGTSPKIKADYLETMFKFKELTGRIFEDQAEVGRALNFMKQLGLTRRKLENINDLLAQYGGQGVGAFQSDDLFKEFADQVQYMIASGNPVGAATLVRQIDKPYWWQYILSARHAMMLSGMGTHAKNAYDGLMVIAREMEETLLAVPGFYVRKGLQAAGKNVKDGVSPQEAAARAYGLLRAALDTQTYTETWNAFKQGHQSRIYSAKIEMQDARIPYLSKVNDALYASDTFFRSFHTNANLYSLGVRKAREDGFTGMRAFEEGTANAMSPTMDMIKEARQLTDTALLVDSPSGISNWAEAAKAIRPNMSAGEQARAFFFNIVFPFLRVTDRLLFQAIRRSPLSVLDKNTRAEWEQGGAARDIAVARTLFGSALIANYWVQAGIGADQEGDVEGSGPLNYKKQQSLEATGYRPNSRVEDGNMVDNLALNLSLNPMGTDNAIASQIASIREAWERGAKGETETEVMVNGISETTRALLGVLASQSYAENMSVYLDPVLERDPSRRDSIDAALVGGAASQFVPAAARQVTQMVLDPERKVTTGDGSFADRVYGRVASGIPGLSEGLPDRVDALGDKMPQGRTLFGIGNKTEIKKDDVAQEIRKLDRETTKPMLANAPSSFQAEGRTIRLTAEQQQKWNSTSGQLIREVMSLVIANPKWKTADKATKVALIKELRTEAYQAGKLSILGDIDYRVQVQEEEL